MTGCVLDASALLAFFFAEPGSGVVAPRLGAAVLSAVNYSETLAKAVECGRPLPDAVAAVARLRLPVVPFDAEVAEVAAALRPATRALGLSLADRACLALGLVRALPVLTADRKWADADVGVRVEVIR